LQVARARFAAGRFDEAESMLRGLAAASPASAETLDLLAACLGAQGRHAEALDAIDQSLQLRPIAPAASLYNRAQALLALGRAAEARSLLESVVTRHADLKAAWSLLGRAHAALGDHPAAERAHREAVQREPRSAVARYQLARFLHERGQLGEAIDSYRQALQFDPGLALAHNDLANALRASGDLPAALAHYEQALRSAPSLVEAWTNYGASLREAGRAAEAIPVLERAVQLQPDTPPVLNNLGIAYYAVRRFDEAERCYRRAIELAPQLDEAHINLGNVLWARGHFDEALARYRRVTERSPENADAHSNLGVALHDLEQVDEAMQAYATALRIRPDHPDALNNLGFLYEQEGRRADAKALYRKALDINPSFARARYNLALALLADFEFAEGWKLSDESRFDITPPVAVRRALSMPRFEGGARKLAVWSEQGVGDQILYTTLLPDLEKRGISFVLQTDARLVPAFKRAHPRWEVVSPKESGAAFAGCDRQIAMGSLPRQLRSTRESFSAQPRALLSADLDRAGRYRDLLSHAQGRLVGISWKSFQPNVRAHVQRRKSAPLLAFLELAQRDDIRLLDLQYGDTRAERDAFKAAGGRLERIDGLDLFADLDGVLAAIEACDLVVTTSNVTAHLAASIGKETWLLALSGVPSFFYWSPDDEGRCLWYPSVRIISGSARRSWPDLFRTVHERLDARAR
jgi:tetratricopeptide (TPR) repeat protein